MIAAKIDAEEAFGVSSALLLGELNGHKTGEFMSGNKPYHTARVLSPDEGKTLMGGFVIYKLAGGDTGGAFALVEHRLGPKVLAAPMHTHHDEDEFSYVLAGEIGAQIGDEVIRAGVGSLVVKPRGVAHTFWNEGTEEARLLELIAPAGFERYFEELAGLLDAPGPPDPARILELAARYGMEMDFESVPELLERYGLRLGG